MDCTQVSNQVSLLRQQIASLERALQKCLASSDDPSACDPIVQDINDTQAELEALLPLQPACEVIVGNFSFDGNGFTGTVQLTIANIRPDLTCTVAGAAVIDAPHLDTIVGIYDGNTGVLTFTRTGDDNNARFQPQQYFGRLFARGATTFAGVFATGAPPALDSSTKGWFMIKQ